MRVMQIGHQLHAAVADVRDGINRLGEGIFLERVGGKSESLHAGDSKRKFATETNVAHIGNKRLSC